MRFQYDPVTDCSVKSNDRFEFYEKIDLESFISPKEAGAPDPGPITYTLHAVMENRTFIFCPSIILELISYRYLSILGITMEVTMSFSSIHGETENGASLMTTLSQDVPRLRLSNTILEDRR